MLISGILWPSCVKVGVRSETHPCLRAYADKESPDQPAQLRSLIRPSLSAARIIGFYRMHQWRAKARMRACACTDWCESAHFAHSRRLFFPWHGQYNVYICTGTLFHASSGERIHFQGKQLCQNYFTPSEKLKQKIVFPFRVDHSE